MHSQQLPLLELCVYTDLVGSYPPSQLPTSIRDGELAESAMTTGPPNPNPPSTFTRLLSAPLDDFLPYTGQERSKWLIDIAHDICDPALKRGTLKVLDEAGGTWRDVNPADPPIASLYLYDTSFDTSIVFSLTKISGRVGSSQTSHTDYPSTMASRVKERDGQCWVSGVEYPLTNSHVCPKRMGNHLLRIVYRNFESTPQAPPPLTLSIYDEICGISLNPTLDVFFDKYELGLRLVAPVRGSSSHLLW